MRNIILVAIMLVSGCSEMMQKATVQLASNDYRMEIQTGGLSEETAKELVKKESVYLCGDSNFTLSITGATSIEGSMLIGVKCPYHCLENRYVVVGNIQCVEEFTPYIFPAESITISHRDSESNGNIITGKNWWTEDFVLRDFILEQGMPDYVLNEGKDVVYFIYMNPESFIYFKRAPRLGGYLSTKYRKFNHIPDEFIKLLENRAN